MKKLKIGLDFHGCIDRSPETFSVLSKILVDSGNEVHIITGSRINDDFKNRLVNEYKVSYTHLFSIADYHESLGTQVKNDVNGNPYMESYLWDRTKADYCERENIDLHIDDSDTYGKHFKKTLYMRLEK